MNQSPIPKFRSHVCSALLMLPACAVCHLHAAGFQESFDYGDGLLGDVSGGKWETYEAGITLVDPDGDALVVNGTAKFQRHTDVVRTFPAVLTAVGQTAVFTCDLTVASSVSHEAYELWLVPATGSFYSSNTNYGSGLGLRFNGANFIPNLTSVEVSEGSGIRSGNNSGNVNPPVIDQMAPGIKHAVRIDLLRGAANVSYTLSIDNHAIRSSTFVLNDDRGLNAMEFAQSEFPEIIAAGSTIDDIAIEPGMDVAVPLQRYEIIHQWSPGTISEERSAPLLLADGNFYGSTGTGGATGLGYLYKLNAAGSLSILATFTGTNGSARGANPSGRLLSGSGGSLYGTTRGGGASNLGTLFRLIPGGAVTPLIDFTGSSGARKGAKPLAGLVPGLSGYYYGTTSEGGATNSGTIFRITTAGALTTLVEFSGTAGAARGARPAAELTAGTGGTLFYGTTRDGGSSGLGTIFKMTPEGLLTTLVEFSGDGAANKGAHPVAELAAGNDGNFYGTTINGGAGDLGTVFKMTPDGALTTLVQFTGNGSANKGAHPATGVVRGADGNFYGTTSEGGEFSAGTLFRITPEGELTTLVQFSGNHGTAPGGNPMAGPLFFGPDGHLYGTTQTGGVYGSGVLFCLRFGPIAITSSASGITRSGATLNGTINPNGSASTVSFEYGSTPTLAGASVISAGTTTDGTAAEPVSISLTGLAADTTYYFRVRGHNQQNTSNSAGAILSFTTLPVERVHEIIAGFDPALSGPGFGSLIPGPDGFYWGNVEGSAVYKMKVDGSEWRTVTFPGMSGSLAYDGAGFMWGVIKGDGYTWGNSDHHGRVSKVNIQTGEITTVVRFTGRSGSVPGANPFAGLVSDSAGNFWGTTRMGGAQDNGTVFKINASSGVVTTVAQFTGVAGNTKGAYPIGSLVSNGAGALLGTTTDGGAFNSGTVFKVDASTGVLTTLVEFSYAGDTIKGAYPASALVNDGSGTLWGTTSRGGGAGFGTVFKMTPEGNFKTVVEFAGNTSTNKGAFPYSGLASDGLGNLWGTTSGLPLSRIYYNGVQFGDPVNEGTVFKVNAATGELTTVVEFDNTNHQGSHPLSDLIRDQNGALIGTTHRGGSAHHGTVFSVNPFTGAVTTLVDFAQNPASYKGYNPYGTLVADAAGFLWGTTATDGAHDAGSIFKVHHDTREFITLVEFTGNGTTNKGTEPHGGLVMDEAGYFWGTTSNGGAFDQGTVFKVNAATSELNTPVEFSSNSLPNKGARPFAGLVKTGDGHLWGTTIEGGASGAGTVFKINASTGGLATVVQFSGNGGSFPGWAPFGGLASDGANFLWGTTRGGGAHDLGTVYKINATTGAMTTVFQFRSEGGSFTGTSPEAGVVWGRDGYFYGTTYFGGTGGGGTVFKVNAGSGALTSLHDFPVNGSGSGGSNPHMGLVRGSDGNFYGTTLVGGPTYNGTVFKIGPSGTLTTLLNFTGYGPQSGSGSGPLYGTLLQGPDGHLYGTTASGGPGGGGTVFRLRLGPAPVTLPVSAQTANGATLNGALNPYGVTTTASFEYGTDPALRVGTVVAAGTVGTVSDPVPVKAQLSGLQPDTTYYYRVRGLNAENDYVQSGAILSFFTSAASSYHSWAAGFGFSGNESAADADPDKDGLKNAVEYLLGSNPSVPTPSPFVVLAGDDSHFILQFPRADESETPDATVMVEAGAGLLAWPLDFTVGPDTVSSSQGVSIVENGNDADLVSVRIPRNGVESTFARLKVRVSP